ncbi:MAG: MFS transporter [Clostridium sp.]|nr:MFS transporter [Clostridium sp.]
MLNVKKQISGLYVSSVLGNLSLTGAWVAILAARGYSLVEIGFAETVFHITSLIFEIPSGVFADVFGRKNMLIASSIMRMTGNMIMILSDNLFMVCASIAFHAVSDNFSSGSDDALAYDSLKMAGNEGYYEKYASNQMVIYRLCSGISTLCAGFALLIGHRAAYSTDILMGIIQIGVLASLNEVAYRSNGNKKTMMDTIWRELTACVVSVFSFLRKEKKVVLFMFGNALVGAVDILLLFFLQAKLPETGMSGLTLGLALFFMQTGGILGAKLILGFKRIRYRYVFAITAILVFFGVLAEHSGQYLPMAAGGFLAELGDDALQVRTNAILQDIFPSEQRATLISVESFTFSVIMIVLSPLAGVLFSHW